MPDNAAVGTWSDHLLTDISMPASELWQYDSEAITLAPLSVNAGELYQWELSREGAHANDDLTGDWTLLELGMDFT